MSKVRVTAMTAMIAVYGLIVIGGYVEGTGSGMACPDWPLCGGRVIPSGTMAVMIEFSHRLAALLVTIFVATTMFLAWKNHRNSRRLTFYSSSAFILLIAQILLGMVTVRANLAPVVSTAHLALATAIFGAVVVTALYASQETTPSKVKQGSERDSSHSS